MKCESREKNIIHQDDLMEQNWTGTSTNGSAARARTCTEPTRGPQAEAKNNRWTGALNRAVVAALYNILLFYYNYKLNI
jgi:hypothetical protein